MSINIFCIILKNNVDIHCKRLYTYFQTYIQLIFGKEFFLIPHGKLKRLAEEAGINSHLICDYIARRKTPTKKRAVYLELVCKRLKINISKEQWIFETTKILKEEISKLELEEITQCSRQTLTT